MTTSESVFHDKGYFMEIVEDTVSEVTTEGGKESGASDGNAERGGDSGDGDDEGGGDDEPPTSDDGSNDRRPYMPRNCESALQVFLIATVMRCLELLNQGMYVDAFMTAVTVALIYIILTITPEVSKLLKGSLGRSTSQR